MLFAQHKLNLIKMTYYEIQNTTLKMYAEGWLVFFELVKLPYYSIINGPDQQIMKWIPDLQFRNNRKKQVLFQVHLKQLGSSWNISQFSNHQKCGYTKGYCISSSRFIKCTDKPESKISSWKVRNSSTFLTVRV